MDIGKTYSNRIEAINKQQGLLDKKKLVVINEILNDDDFYKIIKKKCIEKYETMVYFLIYLNNKKIKYVSRENEYGYNRNPDFNIKDIIYKYFIDPEFNYFLLDKYLSSKGCYLALNKEIDINGLCISLLKEKISCDDLEFTFDYFYYPNDNDNLRNATKKAFMNHKDEMMRCYKETFFREIIEDHIRYHMTEYETLELEKINKKIGKKIRNEKHLSLDLIEEVGMERIYEIYKNIFYKKQEETNNEKRS